MQPVANRDRLYVVLEKKVDFAIARVTATESRCRLVNFSVPYYLDGTVLVTKNASMKELGFSKTKNCCTQQLQHYCSSTVSIYQTLNWWE